MKQKRERSLMWMRDHGCPGGDVLQTEKKKKGTHVIERDALRLICCLEDNCAAVATVFFPEL